MEKRTVEYKKDGVEMRLAVAENGLWGFKFKGTVGDLKRMIENDNKN